MASIQSLGIGSGLLTSELVDDIVKAERAGADLRLDRKEEKVEAQITAYGEVKSAISKLQSASSALANATAIRETQATSSNESALTATTNSRAETGNFQIRIDNIAEAHTVASQRYNAVTDTVGTGTLTFRFGSYEYDGGGQITAFNQNSDGEEFELDISSSNNTLTGIRDTINGSDMGIRASLVNDGQGYRLLFSSEETGAEMAMEITANGDAGLQALAFNAAQNDPDLNMTTTQKAMDANLTVNGLQITSATNSLTEVARGATINLKEATNGSTVNLSIARDPAALVEKTESFIEAYNEYKDLYDELTGFDQQSEQGGLLLGDSALRQVQNQVRRSLGQLVEGLENSSFRTLADIGIYTDRTDDFKLALDTGKLEAAFQESIDDVTGLFANTSTASDPLINYIAKSNDTLPGDYAVEITGLATQGQFEGKSVAAFDFASDVVVGGSNDSFRINIDGTSASVDLDQGNYSSGDDLALMIQNAINNTSAFQSRGRSVTVEFDAVNQKMDIVSSRYGSQSQVYFESMDPTVANSFGFTVPGQGGVSGQYYSNLGEQAFGATTQPGGNEVFQTDAFNLEQNPVSFDLTLTGTAADNTYSFTLDEDLSPVLNTSGEVVEERDRDDMLSYINAEFAAQGLSGIVNVEFNASNRLVFSTTPEAGSQSIELSNVAFTNNDLFGLGAAEGTANSGVTIAPNTEFTINILNRYGETDSQAIVVPDGVYETSDDLAAAIQTAINGDPNISSAASGAKTEPGDRPITDAIDFDSRASGFEFSYNGQSFGIDVNTNAGSDVNGDGATDNLDSIQQAIDNALVAGGLAAGDVTARLESGGLVLETLATGSGEVLDVISDGRGDITNVGEVIAGGLDFSADPVSFTLNVDNTDIVVDLTEDLTGASVDETMAYIQQQLDQGLTGAAGGGQFMPGDVIARQDDGGRLYFETQSKMGSRSSATFGALASIEVTDANAAANTLLGINVAAANMAGQDAFGLSLGAVRGFDAQSTVTYDKDDRNYGRFNITFDNETSVEFTAVTTTAATQLGFTISDGSENQIITGKDVEGTINGTTAIGRGQVLEAGSGTEAATNGYIIGSPGFDFSTAVELDSTTNTFLVNIDGVQSGEINLSEKIYGTGAALAAEMTQKINADTALAAKGKVVEVQYDPDTHIFGIFSASTGAESKVRLSDINSGLSAVTGLTPTSEKVDGKNATGEPDPAQGIQLRVLGGNIGSRGTVNYIQGVFDQLDDLFQEMLSSTGTITTRMDRLDLQMEEIDADRVRLDERLSAHEARLRAQFSFNDRIISQLNSTESFLTQQFEIMNGILANK